MVSLGIEVLLQTQRDILKGKRLGLLCNQASTDRHFRHTRDLILQAFPDQLTCLFSPQHGFFAEKQDNMVESEHAVDHVTALKIFSLYGERRIPDQTMFQHLDTLLVDLVDVGTRVYTFFSTLAYCLEAAAEFGKQVVVLDRPNPLGGVEIEGNLLHPSRRSFVGLYPLPMRHGLTLGELALLVNNHLGGDSIHADLKVIPMQGWRRRMLFGDTALPWVFPSPNMPSPQTALVYPGQVIWEGTNISEGRGTSLPFELFGAPFFRHSEIQLLVGEFPGCTLRPVVFEPTSNKWTGQPCVGFQIHVFDHSLFRPYHVSLSLLQAIMLLYPDNFQYKSPPYEYEYDQLPLDLILGDSSLRKNIEKGVDIFELEKGWQKDLKEFERLRKVAFLYN